MSLPEELETVMAESGVMRVEQQLQAHFPEVGTLVEWMRQAALDVAERARQMNDVLNEGQNTPSSFGGSPR